MSELCKNDKQYWLTGKMLLITVIISAKLRYFRTNFTHGMT